MIFLKFLKTFLKTILKNKSQQNLTLISLFAFLMIKKFRKFNEKKKPKRVSLIQPLNPVIKNNLLKLKQCHLYNNTILILYENYFYFLCFLYFPKYKLLNKPTQVFLLFFWKNKKI